MSTMKKEIKKKPVPISEQETTINLDHGEKEAVIYTCHPPTIKKLCGLLSAYPDMVKLVRDDEYGVEVSLPIKWISVKSPRNISEERRKELAQRMANMNKKQEKASA